MKAKEQVVPKWFEGIIYKEGDNVTNMLSGESIQLNALELSIYDFIMGSNVVFAMGTEKRSSEHVQDYRKALDWFISNNANAYRVLLD
jgi:hypothetical protein